MPRPIWSGTISFGLVSIPVAMFSAASASELHFHLIDQRNKARVKYSRVNEVTGKEVPWESIVKGYEYSHGRYVLLRDEDFKRAAPEASRVIEIEDFVQQDEINPAFYETPYYLVPGKGGEKGYALLRDAMKESGKAGIAKIVIRSRLNLAAVTTRGNTLMLDVMRFADELRDPAHLKASGKSHVSGTTREVALAKQLIDSMTTKWEPARYKNDYRNSLMKWIHKRIKAGKTEKPMEPEKEEKPSRAASIVDVGELLQQSLEGKGTKRKRAAKAGKVIRMGGKSARTRAASHHSAARKKVAHAS